MRVLKLGLVRGLLGGVIGWLFGFALVIGARLALGLPAKWNENLAADTSTVWRFLATALAPYEPAMVVAAIITLTVWPIARRWGARPDNPSILPLPVGRNLAVLVVVLMVAAIGVGAVAAWRGRSAGPEQQEDPS